jgi:hypothetical protein
MSAKKNKTENKTKTKKTSLRAAPRRVRDYPPVSIDELELPIGALLEIGDWMLDHAVAGTNGDPDDLAVVERVRRFMHRTIEGGIAETPTESDLLTAVALAVTAMEKRHGVVGLGQSVAEAIDQVGHVAPHACSHKRAPRVTRHLYCVP